MQTLNSDVEIATQAASTPTTKTINIDPVLQQISNDITQYNTLVNGISLTAINTACNLVQNNLNQLVIVNPGIGLVAPASPISDTINDNWNNAFLAFGGAGTVSTKRAYASLPNTINSNSVIYGDALVIVQYLANAPMNTIDAQHLQMAFLTAEQTTAAAQLAAAQSTPTPAPTQTTTPAQGAKKGNRCKHNEYCASGNCHKGKCQ